MATRTMLLPAGAVLWLHDNTPSGKFVPYAALQDRLAKAQTGDGRGSGGIDALVYQIVGFSTGGAHKHNPIGNNYNSMFGAYINYRANVVSGGHNHPNLTNRQKPATPPPFVALLAVQADEETGVIDKLVCFYHGDLADLPPGWGNCDGTGGRCDGRDRAIRGREGRTRWAKPAAT